MNNAFAEGAARELARRAPRARQMLRERCTAIADQVEPRYRNGARSYSCCGQVAKLWQAAWDGACVALGGKPEDFRR